MKPDYKWTVTATLDSDQCEGKNRTEVTISADWSKDDGKRDMAECLAITFGQVLNCLLRSGNAIPGNVDGIKDAMAIPLEEY